MRPGAFGAHALSVDWEKYASADSCRRSAANPRDSGVVSLVTGLVREITGLSVRHDPIQPSDTMPGNRAHSLIVGEKKPEVRLKLQRLARWEIVPPPASDT